MNSSHLTGISLHSFVLSYSAVASCLELWEICRESDFIHGNAVGSVLCCAMVKYLLRHRIYTYKVQEIVCRTRQTFRREFSNSTIPSRKTILDLVNVFRESDSVSDSKKKQTRHVVIEDKHWCGVTDASK